MGIFNRKSKVQKEAEAKLEQAERNAKKIEQKERELKAKEAERSVEIDIVETMKNGKLDTTEFHIITKHVSGVKELAVFDERNFRDLVSAIYELCPPKIKSIEFGVDKPTGRGDELPPFLKEISEMIERNA